MATPPSQPPPPPPQYPPQPPGYPPQHPRWLTGPVSRRDIRPSRLWYWVAGALGVAAVAGAILIFAGGDEDLGSLTDVFGTLEEFRSPGEVTVDLPEGAEWAIYREAGVSSSEGSFFNESSSSPNCEVRDPSGDLVPLASDFGFTNVTLNGQLYVTDYTFDVAEAGSHTVSCEPGRRFDPPETMLVGERVEFGEIFGFFGRVAAGLALLLLGLLITTAISLPVLLTRSRKLGEARRAGLLRD
jgi:hypothetical protein